MTAGKWYPWTNSHFQRQKIWAPWWGRRQLCPYHAWSMEMPWKALEDKKKATRKHGSQKDFDIYLSNASRYFCLRISKYVFLEKRLPSTLVKPERYCSASSNCPPRTRSWKYFMLKNSPDSFSSLFKPLKANAISQQWNQMVCEKTIPTNRNALRIGFEIYMWAASLNFSSLRNCRIRMIRSSLSEAAIETKPPYLHNFQMNLYRERETQLRQRNKGDKVLLLFPLFIYFYDWNMKPGFILCKIVSALKESDKQSIMSKTNTPKRLVAIWDETKTSKLSFKAQNRAFSIETK